MRTMVICGWLVGAIGVGSQAVAAEVAEATDHLGENIRAEAEAIKNLAAVLKREVDAGTLTLTEDAKGKWSKGSTLWEEIRELGKAGEYGPAYKKAQEARRLMRDALREAFTGKPSKAVGDALRVYVEAVGPRVAAVKNQMKNYKTTSEAKESFVVAEALWEDAKKAAKKKRWDEAFRVLVDCLGELDKVMYEVYPSSR